MTTQPTQPAGEGMADSLLEDLRELSVEMPENSAWQKRIRSAAASADRIIAERDALRQEVAAVRALMDCYNLGGWTDALAPMQRALAAEADRDRLAARCEGLEAVVKELKWRIDDTRDALLRRNGRDESYYNLDEWSTPIVNLRLATEYADRALSPPASDAADSTDGETK